MRYNIIYASVLLVIAICSLGCVSASPPSDSSSLLVLHLDYRNGGDAPMVFALSFFANGHARLDSPRGKTLWTVLDEADRAALTSLRQSEAFSSALEQLRASSPAFGCCDAQEVGIYDGPTAQPVAVRFDALDMTPDALLDLLKMSNRLGKKYFGRHYSLSMPEP